MEKRRLKISLSVSIMLLMSFPLLQQWLNIIEVKPLHGDIQQVKTPTLTKDSWFDASFQSDADVFLKQNYGFQPFFIRTNNQILFSLFREIKANNVILGKEDYLYEGNYIKAYFGDDFVGKDSISIITNDLLRLRDSLRVSGSDLLIILAPGKGSYFPEYFPSEYDHSQKGITNFEILLKQLEEKEIHTLDFKSWFEEMKGKSAYPLYGKGGIHWSKYGEYLAADSMLKYISSNTLARIGSISYNGTQKQKHNKDGDYDIGDGMNLLFDLDTYPMGYPNYNFVAPLSGESDRVVVISDSYYWQLFNKGMSDKCFGGGQFWYYNEAVFPDSYQNPLSAADFEDYLEELRKNKLVILISTDANLFKFPFGVTKMALKQ